MKANTLQINLAAPCNACCPFCVSRMTGRPYEDDNSAVHRALPRVLDFARQCDVASVMLTSSGEPTLVHEDLLDVLRVVHDRGFPVIELQTNGTSAAPYEILQEAGLSTVAFSICAVDPVQSRALMGLDKYGGSCVWDLANLVTGMGMVVRMCLNLHRGDGLETVHDVENLALKCVGHGVQQLTLKRLWTPDVVGYSAQAEWIKDNVTDDVVTRNDEIQRMLSMVGDPIRRLPGGDVIYDVNSVGVLMTSCDAGDAEDDDAVRCLILQPDGHLYTRWGRRGSVVL